MTDIATIKQQIADLGAKADEFAATSDAALALLQGLSASVASLKEQLAQGVPVSLADLDDISNQLAGVNAKLTTSETALETGVAENTPAA